MTLYPPLWAQNTTYPAYADRVLLSALFQPGVVDPAHLAVKPRAQGAAMHVEVQGGTCVIPGPSGNYVCMSDAIEGRDIAPAPSGTNRRYDLVVAQVYDPQATGVGSGEAYWDIEVITGTASTSPTLPEVPDHAIPLAVISLNSGMVSVQASNIIERRPAAQRDSRGVLGRAVRNTDWTVGTAALVQVMTVSFTVLGHRWIKCRAEPSVINTGNAGNAVDAWCMIDGAQVLTSRMRHRVRETGGPGQENRAADGIAVLDPGTYVGGVATRMSPSGQTNLIAPIELSFTDMGEAPASVPPDFVPSGLAGVVPLASPLHLPDEPIAEEA